MAKNQTNSIARNSLYLYIRLEVSTIVGLLTSRLILNALGVVDYGIYNVVGGISTMFIFLNSTMSVSTSRYISFALGNNDNEKLIQYYNQSKIIHYCIAAFVLVLIEIVGLWFLYNNLQIPPNRLSASICILHLTTTVVILNIISTPDTAIIISHEKMKTFAYISLFDSFAKLLLTYIVVFYSGDKLILYAILLLIVQILDRLFYFIYVRLNFKQLRSKLKFNKCVFNDMLSFAGWNLLGNMAVMTIEQGITIVLNMFFGPAINAARGLATNISTYVNSLANNARMAINPQITKSYAEGNIEYMHKLISLSSLSCFYILLTISIPLLYLSDYILQIWLGNVPQYTSLFLKLTLLYTLANSFSNPIIIGIHATGNIKKFQLTEAVIMLLTLPCAYFILRNGYPPYSVYVTTISFAIFTQIGRLIIILPKINMGLKKYNAMIMIPSFKVLCMAILFIFISNHLNTDTVISNICISIISIIYIVVIIFSLGISREERKRIIELLRNKYVKIIKN